jgi:hypothetical protein
MVLPSYSQNNHDPRYTSLLRAWPIFAAYGKIGSTD